MSTIYKFPAALRTARVEAKMSMRQLSSKIVRSGQYIAILERGGTIVPTRSIATRIARAISTHAKHTRAVSAQLENDLIDRSREDAIAHALRRWQR